MSKDDWKELDYTDEQAEELERLSMLGSTGKVDAHVADKILRETMKKYELEKENKSMSNKELLGNSLKEQFTEASESFAKWISASTSIMETIKSVKAGFEAIKELDDSLVEMQKVTEMTTDELKDKSCADVIIIDLKNVGIDVSLWKGDVKPVKAILSVNMFEKTTCEVLDDIAANWNSLETVGDFNVNLAIGNMVLLMEDGTFRMNQ